MISAIILAASSIALYVQKNSRLPHWHPDGGMEIGARRFEKTLDAFADCLCAVCKLHLHRKKQLVKLTNT